MFLKKIFIIFASVFIISCVKQPPFKTAKLFMMDTIVEITVPYINSDEIKTVEELMQRLADTISADSKAISESDDEVVISAFTYSLLKREDEYFALSDGRFNSTIITISSLYGFPDKDKIVPNDTLLNRIKSFAIGGRVSFREYDGRYFARGGGLKIDLSAFAKGAIVDEAVRHLKENNIDNFIINAGGDLYASGQNINKGWSVGITNPKDKRRVVYMLDISDKAVATSGIYERYFISPAGKHISHIFDGKTGEATTRYQSVTVVADNTEKADAFSTIYFLMGVEEISKRCKVDNTTVYIINDDVVEVKLCESKN